MKVDDRLIYKLYKIIGIYVKNKINKKIELEQNLQDILKEVSKYKHALRELNAVNRDY